MFIRSVDPEFRQEEAINFIRRECASVRDLEIFITEFNDPYFYPVRQVYSTLKPLHDELLESVISGNKGNVEKIIQDNPALAPLLLTLIGFVKDNNVEYQGTALQLAADVLDVKFHPNEEGIADMLIRYMKNLPNGRRLIIQQMNDFKAEQEKQSRGEFKECKKRLKSTLKLIKDLKRLDICENAVFPLIDYLNDQFSSDGMIKTGRRVQIEELYVLTLKHLDTIKIPKYAGLQDRYYFCTLNDYIMELIVAIGNHLPTHLVRAICQDLIKIVNEEKEIDRNMIAEHKKLSKIRCYPNCTPKLYQSAKKYFIGRKENLIALVNNIERELNDTPEDEIEASFDSTKIFTRQQR